MFLLCWTSGHVPPRTMYYTETETGWSAGEDRTKAKQFSTVKQAVNRWRSLLNWPDDKHYVDAWNRGGIRVERADQIGLCL